MYINTVGVRVGVKVRVRVGVFKKSLKIPTGQSESVYRRTDNTMAKRKRTK
jgi:hypothetical protein